MVLGSITNFCFGLFLALLNISFVGTDDGSDFQKSIPALVVWAVPGKDIELPCDVTSDANDQVNMVLWFKDNTGIPVYSLDARDGPITRAIHWAMSNDLGSRTNFLIGKPGRTYSRLKINKVISSDQGIFRCRIDYNNSPTKNFKVNLTLIEQPSEPIIYDAQGREVFGEAGPFKEGYDLFLSCHVVGGRPKPKVTWWEGDRLLDSVMESVTPSLVVNQYFRVNVSRSLYNTSLKCKASVLDIAPSLVKDVRIEVYLKPKEVNLFLLTEVLVSGRPRQYHCESWGSVPPARISWLLDGEPVRSAAVNSHHDSNVTQSVLTYRPSATDNGKDLTCRAENPRFPGSIKERKMKLTVLYPPMVTVKRFPGPKFDHLKEGHEIRLVCEIDSNPEFDRIIWFHNDVIVEQNDSLGILISGRKLELLNLSREQAGEYYCMAGNTQGEGTSEPIIVNILYAPRCKEKFKNRRLGALRRDTLDVRCEVTANPSDDVRFGWTFNKSGDVLPLQSSRVNSSGLSSHVQFTPMSESDFGTLACWASNSVGRQAEPCMIHIFPARVPDPPKDCYLKNHTSGNLELICSSSYDGGLQQHFMLEVTEMGPETDILVSEPGTAYSKDLPGFKMLGSQPLFVLRGLQPEKLYRLSVFAINAKGISDPPVVLTCVNVGSSTARLTSTEINENAEGENENNPMVIALGTLVAVALLVIVGVAIAAALVLCKKRSVSDINVNNGKDDDNEKDGPKNERTFILNVPGVRSKKLNNMSRNREVAPPEVDGKALQTVQEALPPEKRNSIVKYKRESFSPSNVEYDAGCDDRKKELKTCGMNNARNIGFPKQEDIGRRAHPRVTLGPEGQVMKCIIAEVPDSKLETISPPGKEVNSS